MQAAAGGQNRLLAAPKRCQTRVSISLPVAQKNQKVFTEILDLCTDRVSTIRLVGFSLWPLGVLCNYLLLNGKILINCCTKMKTPLRDGYLAALKAGFPQSYPQILWVMCFPLTNSLLGRFQKQHMSFGGQATERQ